MLSLLKKGPSANKVPAEKIQATYGRYRMQALLRKVRISPRCEIIVL